MAHAHACAPSDLNSYSGQTIVNDGTLRLVSVLPSPDRDWVADSLSGADGTGVGVWTDLAAGRQCHAARQRPATRAHLQRHERPQGYPLQ